MIRDASSECRHILDTYFNVIGNFNLNTYANRMQDLYRDLSNIRKSHYEINDRIVFRLHDHDFYLDNQGPGWILYNLQLILNELDISNFFCLLLTSYPDYSEYTSYVQKNLTVDDFPIRSVTSFLDHSYFFKDIKPESAALDQIEKPYCVLSRQQRPHRTFFLSKLYEIDQFTRGIVNFHNIPITASTTSTEQKNHANEFSDWLLKIPQHQQRLLLRNPHNRDALAWFQKNIPNFINYHENVDVNVKSTVANLSCSPLSNAFLYVGLETQANSPRPHMSRISLRGMLDQRPFVLFGSPGLLSLLRDRGFKTFGDFWDESYDSVTDIEGRVDRILGIVDDIASRPISDLKKMFQEMQSIIQHNYDFYLRGWYETESQKLKQECENNQKGH